MTHQTTATLALSIGLIVGAAAGHVLSAVGRNEVNWRDEYSLRHNGRIEFVEPSCPPAPARFSRSSFDVDCLEIAGFDDGIRSNADSSQYTFERFHDRACVEAFNKRCCRWKKIGPGSVENPKDN